MPPAGLGPLTDSIFCIPPGGSAKHLSEQCFQEQNQYGEREYAEAVSRILFQQVRGDACDFHSLHFPIHVYPTPFLD